MHGRCWGGDVWHLRRLGTETLSQSEQWLTRRCPALPVRLLGRQVVTMTDSCTDVNTHHTPSLCGASGHGDTVTLLRFNWDMTSRPHLTPTIRCFLILQPSLPPSVLPSVLPSFPSFPSTGQAEHASGQPPQTGSTATEAPWCAPLGPLRSHLHYQSTPRLSCGTSFGKQRVVFSILWLLFSLFPADCALSLSVGYCDSWRDSTKVKVLIWPKMFTDGWTQL